MHSQNEKGTIAQLVEQRTENPCVPGSIPGGTTYKRQTQLNINQLRFLFDEFAPHLHHIMRLFSIKCTTFYIHKTLLFNVFINQIVTKQGF